MRINKEQEDILKNFKCERLSSNRNNIRDIEVFLNTNESLSDTLKNEAYELDENNNVAYYLIKDENDDIFFYFSLKCGSLFDMNVDYQRKIEFYEELILKLEQKYESDETSKSNKETLCEELKKIKDIKEKMPADVNSQKTTINCTENVGATYSGIEIVQFCINERMREKWTSLAFPQKLGVVVFWKFIVPIIIKARELVGCQYLYLFAIDQSSDENLINYYKKGFHFKDAYDQEESYSILKTYKPLYDSCCRFMYQEAEGIEKKQESFYEHFNPEEDDI